MAYLTEPVPERGVPLPVAPGIRRIVADNPSVMTYHGTNTYLIEGADGFTVLDPGPDDNAHVEHILAATGGRIRAILVSHTHHDHVGAAPALKARTGVPVAAFHTSADPAFTPDLGLHDGDVIAGLTALYTPGHARDHLCFAGADGILFTADHVMSWSSSVVSPPGGDMADYFASLRRLLARDDRILLPGHGPRLDEPKAFVQALLDHRLAREGTILSALGNTLRTPADLRDALYSQTHPRLRLAAERNVIAHLLKLEAEGLVEQADGHWRSK
jgi:glyoxylase-like metal-dependent hydrolase (beta-lactamase superfamily II)